MSRKLPTVANLAASATEDPHMGNSANPNSNGAKPGGASPPSTPRWVKVLGVVALLLVLLVALLHLTGIVGMGGHH